MTSVILAYVVDVEARIKEDPTTAREALRRLLLDGKIIMHPQPDGSWRGESPIAHASTVVALGARPWPDLALADAPG